MRKLSSCFLCAATILFGCGNLLAQEETFDIAVAEVQVSGDQDGEQGEFGAPMIFQTIESSDDGTETNMMRVVAGDAASMAFVGDGGSMVFGGGSDSFSMLNNPSVKKELELVDDQVARISEINKEFGKRIKDSLGDIKNGDFDPTMLKVTMAEIHRQKKEEINKLLLPHQQERLRQVSLQRRMKSRGTANSLTSDELAEALGLTSDQVTKLKTRSKELQKEIAERTSQLKEDAKQELIGILSSKQQEKLNEMLGDDFKSNSDDWKSGLNERFQKRLRHRASEDN